MKQCLICGATFDGDTCDKCGEASFRVVKQEQAQSQQQDSGRGKRGKR